MDCSFNTINNTTLEYLMNPSQYDKFLKKSKVVDNAVHQREMKFYRKRIISLTRNLFKNELEDRDMLNSFNCYVSSCIDYLKFIDKSDIIQDDYNDISQNLVTCDNIDLTNVNELMMTNSDVKKCTLDTFVKVKNKKSQRKIVPKQKHIDLNDPKLKVKGLKKKKKNITNNYEENKEKQ
jgi:hypothetical protein